MALSATLRPGTLKRVQGQQAGRQGRVELREGVRVPLRATDSLGQTKPHLAGLVSLQPAPALLLLLPILPSQNALVYAF